MGLKHYVSRCCSRTLYLSLIILAISNVVIAQPNCTIRTGLEPTSERTTINPSIIQQQKQGAQSVSWEVKSTVADTIKVALGAYKRSNVLHISDWGSNIPPGAIIEGIKLKVTGRSEGLGRVADVMVTLSEGDDVSDEYAGQGYSAYRVWNKTAIDTWHYGRQNDSWGNDWTASQINSAGLTLHMQVRNISSQPITATITNIAIEVTYRQLPTFCANTCPTYYVEERPSTSYEWTVPQGFMRTSASNMTYIIDIKPLSTTPHGIYEICADVTEAGSTAKCCRSIRYVDCKPGTIGDMVWSDNNQNGLQDIGESGIANINVTLYQDNGTLVASTRTNSQGKYSFSNVVSGRYYVKFDDGGVYEYTVNNNSDFSRNNDVTGVNGKGTTNTFFLDFGQNKTDIDAGLIRLEDLSGRVFEDKNGDGQANAAEAGIPGIKISIVNQAGDTIRQTFSDATGNYLIQGIAVGVYMAYFDIPGTYRATLANEGVDATDSDIDASGLSEMFFVPPGGKSDVFAGLYKPASIRGIVWLDANYNGQWMSVEDGMPGVELQLFNVADSTTRTVVSNGSGAFVFDNLSPGLYTITILSGADGLIPTIVGQNILLDQGGVFTTDAIMLMSGQAYLSAYLGLVEPLTSICGQVWFDEDFDGLIDNDEGGVEGVRVDLLDNTSTSIRSIVSNAEGRYCFDSMLPDLYKIAFTIGDSMVFSPYMESPDANGSDVADDDGNTIFLSPPPSTGYSSVDAGIALKASIGDYIWYDSNGDGIQDDTEEGLEGIEILLVNTSNDTISKTLSGPDGFYLFEYVYPDNYFISVTFPDSLIASATLQGIDKTKDNNLQNASRSTEIFFAKPNEDDFDIDLGLKFNYSKICAISEFDYNVNGKYDETSFGALNDLEVVLMEVNSSNMISFPFDEFAQSCLEEVKGGRAYKVCFEKRTDLQPTIVNTQGGLGTKYDALDSNYCSAPFFVPYGDQSYTVYGGFTSKGIIGDYIWDDVNKNGIQDTDEPGLAGVKVLLRDTFGLEAFSTTSDSTGYYEIADIPRGTYSLELEKLVGYEFTSQGVDPFLGSSVDAMGITGRFYIGDFADIDSLDVGYIKTLGSICGIAWEDTDEDGQRSMNESGIEGLEIWLYDEDLNAIKATTTDVEGKYCFNNLVEGLYLVVFEPLISQPFTDANIGNDISDSDVILQDLGRTDFVNLVAGQNLIGLDGGYLPTGGMIMGMTWRDKDGDGIMGADDSPLPMIPIQVFSIDSTLVMSGVSDMSGKYSFPRVRPGSYYLVFGIPDTCSSPTLPYQGVDITLDSDIINDTLLSTDTIMVVKDSMYVGLNGGFVGMSSVSGMVFIDINENGLRDPIEEGFNGIAVCLIDTLGNIIAKDTTALVGTVDGYYKMNGIRPGKYSIQFTKPFLYTLSPQNVGNIDSLDSDVMLIDEFTVGSDTFDVYSKMDIKYLDCGLYYRPQFISIIEGQVWTEETPADGQYDGGMDRTKSGITINLVEVLTGMQLTTTSDSEGHYKFDNLPQGIYYLNSPLIADTTTTFYNIGLPVDRDNNFFYTDSMYRTALMLVSVGDTMNHVDLGLSAESTIGDLVWEDLNFNGLQGPDEPGIIDVKVYACDALGHLIDSTFTDMDGHYEFTHLPSSDYFIKIQIPEGMSITVPTIFPMNINNDFNELGESEIVTLSAGERRMDIDAGLVANGSIGDRIWVDFDGDGIQDMGEPGISELEVMLYDENDNLVSIDTTEGNMNMGQGGFYNFSNIRPGNYYVVFDVPIEYRLVQPNVGDDNLDSDVTGGIVDNSTDYFFLAPGDMITNMDCGIFEPSVLGDYVWHDINEDGIQDQDEPGLAGVEVTLKRSSGAIVATTVTDSSGRYTFSELKQGLYFAEFGSVTDFTYTIPNAGNGTDDSDVQSNGATPLISLAHGVSFLDLDCGYVATNRLTVKSNQNESPSETFDRDLIVKEITPNPNPAVNETRFIVEEDGMYTLSLYDKFGTLRSRENLTAQNNQIRVNTRDLVAGVYYFKLEGKRYYKGKLLRVH